MRKSVLKRLKVLRATSQIKKLVREDVGKTETWNYGARYGTVEYQVYKTYRYFRAEEEDGILKIGVFTRASMAAGQSEPDFTTFIDRKEKDWISYNHKDGSWSKAMIFNLPVKTERGESYGSYTWSSKKEDKLVQEYLGTCGDIRRAVREYQTEQRKEQLKRRHRSEMDKIDEFMQTVPEEPKDFKDWILKSAFRRDTYLIMKPGKVKEAYCTYCKKMVPIRGDKPKHNEDGVCPKCRSIATWKSYGKQKVLKDDKNVCLLQRTTDGEQYVLRVYYTYVKWKQKDGYREPEVHCSERFRFRGIENLHFTESFEWGFWKNTMIKRWCNEKPHGGWFDYNFPTTYGVLYEKNIEKLLENTQAKYVPVKAFLKRTQGASIEVSDMFREFMHRPDDYEKLLKVGMYNLTLNAINRMCETNELLWGNKKLEDLLYLNKEYSKLAVRMNADVKELKIIQAGYRERVSLDEEIVGLMKRYYGHHSRMDDLQIIIKRSKLLKMLHYLTKLEEESGNKPHEVSGDYEDYLEQLYKLHIPIDKHSRFPANFYHVHAELAAELARKEDAEKRATTRKKNKKLKELVKGLKEQYKAKSDKYEIVWPECRADFVKEGQLQHNCVGGYFERCAEGETVVFFLREKENVDIPFCTVEFRDGKLIQCRTKYNGTAPEEALKYMEHIAENYKKTEERKEREHGRVAS